MCGSGWDENFKWVVGLWGVRRPVCGPCDEAAVRDEIRWEAGFAKMVAEAQYFLEADHEFENLR